MPCLQVGARQAEPDDVIVRHQLGHPFELRDAIPLHDILGAQSLRTGEIQIAHTGAQNFKNLDPGEDLVARPLRRPTHVHVLDEAHLGARSSAVLQQIDKFVLVYSPHQRTVSSSTL